MTTARDGREAELSLHPGGRDIKVSRPVDNVVDAHPSPTVAGQPLLQWMPGDVGEHSRVVLSRKADATRAWPCPSSYDRFGTISAVRLGANLSPPIVANWVANHWLALGTLKQKLGARSGWRCPLVGEGRGVSEVRSRGSRR